jgi:PAS domain S-box-containing protein
MVEKPHEWDGIYWRALVEASPDVLVVVDLTGTILFVNRVVSTFAGRTVLGSKLWDFAVGEDAKARLGAKLREIAETKKALVYEHPGFRPDGTSGWYEVRAIPVILEGKVDRVLWASSDISERKHVEAQLRQAQKMDAIGQLAGGVAHDFNNLLSVIMGFGDLAAQDLPPGHPIEEHLREVLDAARRGADLTRKLLAFSRNQVIQPRRLDLGAIIADFARVMSRLLGEDIALVLDAAPGRLSVHADPVQLEQVLMNLWMNARQAMPAGGALRVSTHEANIDQAFATKNPWARRGAFAEVRVTDAGVGMDEATLGRIFEPFFTTKDEGTGLGLSTVYGIVQQHGGFLQVESAPGTGTTVHVFLPRVETETEPTKSTSA